MFGKSLFPNRCCQCDRQGFDGQNICRFYGEYMTVNGFYGSQWALPMTSVPERMSTLCDHGMASRILFDSTISPYLAKNPADNIVQALTCVGQQNYGR